MNREPYRLTAADRAELCRRVDLPAMLAGDGVEVRRNGAAFVCKLRADERTASCYLYPPGVGRKGADGWTLKDYGDGWGGDALAYLVDKRGLSFVDAVAELCRLAGWTPADWEKHAPGCPRTRQSKGGPTVDTPPPRAPTVPTMAHEAQLDAALAFVIALDALCPDATAQGQAYLDRRGCLPDGASVAAWMLPCDTCAPLAAKLAASPEADLLTLAGILKPAAGKPPRLAWWDKTCLLGCHDQDGNLAYFIGRRVDWTDGDRWGKYVNQGTAGGAVRWPFNLPALYQAAGRLDGLGWKPAPDKAGDVLLVEGALDALGAACLGWPAVALLNRPQAHNYKDRDGAAARMLEAHLPALRDVRRVRVVPDADPGPKGAEGEALAARLVGWLRFAGVRADVARLVDLVPDAPEGCKDLADVAKARNNPPTIQPLPAGLADGATVEALDGSRKETAP